MEIVLPLLLVVGGLFVIIKGADLLVSGASSFANTLKINPLVIGLTVVAFGTSAPELTVSLSSSLAGSTDLALGNIVGSNIANILLILGISAMICNLTVQKNTIWKEIPMSFLGAILLFVLALQSAIDQGSFLNIPLSGNEIIGEITATNGIVLLSFFVVFLYYTFGISKLSTDMEIVIEKRKPATSILMVAMGALALIFGSKFMVDGGTNLALQLGVSEVLIGLTLLAVGTSLPELVTSVVAATKKEVDIAVGNVIGSNIFNIFLILGVTSLATPIPLKAAMVSDIFVLFAATIFLFISLFIFKKRTLTRFEGSIMLICYFTYIGFVIFRG